MNFQVRRLLSADAAVYQCLRLEGLERHPDCFRISPEDEAALSTADVAKKLENAFVLGGFEDETLVGIAGLSVFAGVKVQHRALLWGMYVRRESQGKGIADALIEGLLAEARRLKVEQVELTVIAQNARAIKTYERWGFKLNATDLKAVKVGETYYDEQLRVCRLA